MVKNAIILAAGYGMRMVPLSVERPKALIKIQDEVLIERMIRQLHEANVFDIKIVVGFMKESFEYLIDKYDVELIVNKDYENTNTMYSLYLAKNYIKNTYILSSDVWLKENIFNHSSLNTSWYLLQKNNHGNLKVKDNSLIYYSNQGTCKALGGIAYVTGKTAVMLKERLSSEKIDYEFFWEKALTNQADQLMLTPFYLDSKEGVEFNTYEQLVEFQEDDDQLHVQAIDIIEECLKTSKEHIKNIRTLKKGMTNRSFIFSCNDERYIMRIPGKGTDELIDRQEEAEVYKVIEEKGYGEPILFIDPKSGYKLTKYMENTRNCDIDNWNDIANCMEYLKKFHKEGLKVNHTFDLYKEINFYEKLRGKTSLYSDYDLVKENVFSLKKYIDKQEKQWTLCHIDANADNFLIDKNDEQKITLIDWEYAGMQDPHVDVAMFGIYAMYDKEKMDRLIDTYFDGKVRKNVRVKIYAYIATCGLLWSNWCEYKHSLGIDFGEYSLAQYRYAKEYYQYAKELMGE